MRHHVPRPPVRAAWCSWGISAPRSKFSRWLGRKSLERVYVLRISPFTAAGNGQLSSVTSSRVDSDSKEILRVAVRMRHHVPRPPVRAAWRQWTSFLHGSPIRYYTAHYTAHTNSACVRALVRSARDNGPFQATCSPRLFTTGLRHATDERRTSVTTIAGTERKSGKISGPKTMLRKYLKFIGSRSQTNRVKLKLKEKAS
ncbi:Hypothetical protein NTJ_14337 [Nesidiocoris tenuis]|uniref:Uncharacterized protein n=1 Tax=Nesidiocoris tenuis TaxID=355587 RepID=A0ABN7BEB7_9HEMI|nr:Hypothetical protein NTJ_14337 [Nesidiocoris tenuis]